MNVIDALSQTQKKQMTSGVPDVICSLAIGVDPLGILLYVTL